MKLSRVLTELESADVSYVKIVIQSKNQWLKRSQKPFLMLEILILISTVKIINFYS